MITNHVLTSEQPLFDPRLQRLLNVTYISVFSLLFLHLLNNGFIIRSDGPSYIHAAVFRSSLYPTLLAGYRLLFGDNNYQGFVLLQLCLGYYGCWFTATSLTHLFKLDSNVKALCFTLLLSPYFFGDYRFANLILSDAIAYPLFLIAISQLLRGLIEQQTNYLLHCLGLLILCILTRRQFLFVYPAFAILLSYIAFYRRQQFQLLTLVLVFIGSMLVTNLLERSYQYLVHDHFTTVPFVGFQLVNAPLYVANAEDAAAFTDPLQRHIFTETFSRLTAQNATLAAFKQNKALVDHHYHHFAGVYNTICWYTLKVVLAEHGITDWYAIDAITLDMTWTLLKRHPLEWFKLYFANVNFKMGGYYYTVLFLLLLGFSALMHLRHGGRLSLTLFVVSLLTFGNYTATALVEPINRRYACYTETLLACVLLISLFILLQDTDSKES